MFNLSKNLNNKILKYIFSPITPWNFMNHNIHTAIAFTLFFVATISASSPFPFVAKYKTPFGTRYTHFITSSRSIIIEIEKGTTPKGSYQNSMPRAWTVHYSPQKTMHKLKQLKALFKKQNYINQKIAYSKR